MNSESISALTNGHKPRISALVSTYNSSRFLAGCLEDLLAQSVSNELEIIIINSGSEESESAIAKEFTAVHSNILYLETERETLYSAWNRGIKIAKGTYVCNANTDDRHHPYALELMASELDKRPDIDLVYADSAVTRTPHTTFDKGSITGCFHWPNYSIEELFKVCFIGPQPMWRRSLHDEHGLFDGSFTSAGDYEFWLRICKPSNIHHINRVLGLYLERKESIEHLNTKINQNESDLARKRYRHKLITKPAKPQGNFLKHYSLHDFNLIEKSTASPKISVIIPTRNRPCLLPNALKSVTNQTFKDIEIVVVNDGGIDASHLLSSETCSDIPIRYLSFATSSGAASARNAGIRNSRGEYIAYLDDDDILYPDHLETLFNLAITTGSSFVVSKAYMAFHDNIERPDNNPQRILQYSEDWDLDGLLSENHIPTLTVMHHRSCLDNSGYFDETMTTHEDWDLWIRMVHANKCAISPMITAEYRVAIGHLSLTSSQRKSFLKTMQQIHARYIRLAVDKATVLRKQKNAVSGLKSELFLCHKILHKLKLWKS